jgi:hypothetical protein
METDPSSTASISQEVLPSLETQMLKFLIPNYFENYCDAAGDNVARKTRELAIIQRNLDENRGTMMGISSLPADKVMTRGKVLIYSIPSHNTLNATLSCSPMVSDIF